MRNKILITLVMLLVVTMMLTGCSALGLYDDYDAMGYNIAVRYDANGGLFAGSKDVYITDVYNLNDFTAIEGKVNLSLLEPGDKDRGDEGVSFSTATLTGYLLAGWYQSAEPIFDADGNAVDAFGNLTSDSGKPQAYTYADPWDFENDVLPLDVNGNYTANNPVITLYAAWIPTFTYEFKAPKFDDNGAIVVDENGEIVWEHLGNYNFNPFSSSSKFELPEVASRTGLMDTNDVPKIEGMTFDAIYSDAACTVPFTSDSTHIGTIDKEHAVAVNPEMVLYTTWLEGTHVYLSEAAQLDRTADTSYNYHLIDDLDFEGGLRVWPSNFTFSEFTGTFDGDGHTISNVSATQTTDATKSFGGLFGTIGSGAVVSNVKFENVEYSLTTGTIRGDNAFGLFAGIVANGAVVEDVTVGGKLLIGNMYASSNFTSSYYAIGLAVGKDISGKANISYGDITFGYAVDRNGEEIVKFTITQNGDRLVLEKVVTKSEDK